MRSGDEERRSEGRFCGLPGPGGPARLRLAGRSRDVSGSRSAAVLGAPGAARGSRGAARSREDGCARGVRAGSRCAACCILRPPGGSRGPGSLSGCSSQAHPAGARLFPQPPYAWLSVLSLLFTTAARALPKMPAAPSRCGARLRGVIGSGWMDAAVSPSSRGARPAPVAPVPLRSKVRRPPSQLGFAGFGTAMV